jgi:DNA topoisomerase-3
MPKQNKVLILAEKPSQARDYAKAFKNCKERKGYIDCGNVLITWAIGHLFEIDDSVAPKRWSLETLPIFPEKFKLKLRRGAGKQFKVIKELLKKVDEVWIGTDPGREGELIAREILLMAGWKKWDKVKRIWTSEALTPEVVKKALKNLKPAKELDGLYYSALARQHADWIVGINLTRAVSLKAKDKSVWSVGRVQTPALKILLQREEEIKNFKPTPYWVIKALFEKDRKKFGGVLVLSQSDLKGLETEENPPEEEEEERKPAEGSAIKDKKLALRIYEEVKKVPYGVVVKVDKKLKKEPPPPLHSLTTLQREANKLFGYPASKTLAIAQKLYEHYKVISYPRTDSQHLAESNKPLVKEVLKKLGKEELIPAVDKVGKRVFNDKKLTDHHAIIPLSPPPKGLTGEEKNIYHLIWRRFVGAFMGDYIYEVTTAVLKVGNYTFASRGKTDIALGWKSLYKETKEETNLPPLKKGEKVKKVKTLMEEKKTQPPPRYSEGMLLKKMEKLGLGTPATRAQIIETLKRRKYVTVKGKKLIPTQKAVELLKLLETSEVSSPEMTAKWEEKLEEIYRKGLNYRGYKNFLETIKKFTSKEVERLKTS